MSLGVTASISSRDAVSRWFLRSVCARPEIQMGYRGEFLGLGHSDVTDTDILLDDAAMRLDAMVESSVASLPDKEMIIQNYVREMFPVYTADILAQVIEYVTSKSSCRAKFSTMRLDELTEISTTSDMVLLAGTTDRLVDVSGDPLASAPISDEHLAIPLAHITKPPESMLSPRRPTKPRVFAIPESPPRQSSSSSYSLARTPHRHRLATFPQLPLTNVRLVDRLGNILLTDQEGKITQRGGRFTGASTKPLPAQREYTIKSIKNKSTVTSEMLCVFKIFMANTLPDAKLSVWPGVPQYENMDPIITVRAPTEVSGIRIVCHSQDHNRFTYPEIHRNAHDPTLWELDEPLRTREYSSVILFFRNSNKRDIVKEDNVPLLVTEFHVKIGYAIELLLVR